MAECNQVYVAKTYDEPGEARDTIREVSEAARHGVAETSRGNQFNAKDRADQDRYLAGEFRGLGVQAASFEARLQKDRTDGSEWDNERYRDLAKDVMGVRFELSKDIERNGRSAELATEKTAAATQLAIEKTAAAALLDSAKNAAAAALCCCETEARIAASTAAILKAMCDDQTAELRRQLTVFQVRAIPGTGSSPV